MPKTASPAWAVQHRTAIIPKHDTVARGTLKSILIQAGIELDEFLKLL